MGKAVVKARLFLPAMSEGEASAGWSSPSLPSRALVAALSAWVSLNVLINFWNKWALSPEGASFSFPIFYSSCHMAMGLLSSSLIMAAVPSVRNLSPTQIRQHGGKLLLLSTLTVANIACSNASLMYIGLSVNQIIKSVGPLPALVLMRGAATLPPLTVLWYDSFFSFMVMIALWSASGERDASIVYMREHKSTGLVVVLVGSTVAFLYNLSTFYLTFFTSGLTINIIANTKQVVMIIFSAIVVEHVTSVLSWTGVAIFVAALGTYTYLTIGPSKANHQWSAEEQPVPVANGKVGAAETVGPEGGSQAPASERTPILKAGGT